MEAEKPILSIIIPYYKVMNKKLFELLTPQLLAHQDEVEVIVVDDGCNEKSLDKLAAKVIHLPTNSGGASVPRNVGLDNAQGKYIAFVDADDYVYGTYVDTILHKIANEDFDYCYLSWCSSFGKFVIKDQPPTWNCCVWNCIYKKSIIGNERFDPNLRMAEDYDFNKRVRKGKKANIIEVLYYYDTQLNPQSITKTGSKFRR